MDMIDTLREIASAAFAGTPVKFAYVFGSVARGEAHERSDVDIAIYVADDVDSHERFKMSLSLPAEFDRTAKREVDMVVLNDASLSLQGRVVSEGVPIYSTDEAARVSYESLTFREFCDFEIFIAPLREQFIRDTAEGRR